MALITLDHEELKLMITEAVALAFSEQSLGFKKEVKLINSKEVAELLRISPYNLTTKVMHMPFFPKPKRGGGVRENKFWLKSDVEKYILKTA
jgi:predicted DNA-binding transcriptional regulator AlpA